MFTGNVVSESDTLSCTQKVNAVVSTPKNSTEVATFCSASAGSTDSLGTCVELLQKIATHHKTHHMTRCTKNMQPVSAYHMICIKDGEDFCPFDGWGSFYAKSAYMKVFSGSSPGYLADCGEEYGPFSLSPTGTDATGPGTPHPGTTTPGVSTSSSTGSDLSPFKITNRGDGEYSVDYISTASGWVEGDTVTILGSKLGGTTPANDFTLTASTYTGSTTAGGVTTQWTQTSLRTRSASGSYNGGTPASLPGGDAELKKCFDREMDKICTPCKQKAGLASVAYMMSQGDQDCASTADMYDYIGQLNRAACMKVEGEGYCISSFAKTQKAMQGKGSENPYCDKTLKCPQKFMTAYAGESARETLILLLSPHLTNSFFFSPSPQAPIAKRTLTWRSR